MSRLLVVLRSLGNAGAVANAGAMASARRREDWLVAALVRATRPPVVAPRPPAASRRRSAAASRTA